MGVVIIIFENHNNNRGYLHFVLFIIIIIEFRF